MKHDRLSDCHNVYVTSDILLIPTMKQPSNGHQKNPKQKPRTQDFTDMTNEMISTQNKMSSTQTQFTTYDTDYSIHSAQTCGFVCNKIK